MSYSPIPEGATRLGLDVSRCEMEGCGCGHFEIYFDDVRLGLEIAIWVYYFDRGPNPGELRAVIGDACRHYGIEADLSSDSIYNWKGERQLGGG